MRELLRLETRTAEVIPGEGHEPQYNRVRSKQTASLEDKSQGRQRPERRLPPGEEGSLLSWRPERRSSLIACLELLPEGLFLGLSVGFINKARPRHDTRLFFKRASPVEPS